MMPLSIEEVRDFLPHRAPFLLVDRILDIHVPGESGEVLAGQFSAPLGTRVVGLKNVTYNEPYFLGHFPNRSLMPGVLILETMAQVASFSVYPSAVHQLQDFRERFQCILVGVNEARFRRPVVPGDSLRIESEVIKIRGHLVVFHCQVIVEGQKAAEAEIMANLLLQEKKV